MSLTKNLFAVLAFLGLAMTSQIAAAQKDTSLILDTIYSNGKAIVLYSDNVWTYVSTLEELERDKRLADTAKVFNEYWNDITFAYLYPEPGPLPDTVKIPLLADGRSFTPPLLGGITSGYGWRSGRAHKAVDIGLDQGTPVRAAFDGKVRYAAYNTGGYGNLVIIRHFNGLETYYAHLSRMYVKPNQLVKAGQLIGGGGNTGAHWAGPHLHFECRYRDHAFDPMKIMRFDSLGLKCDTLVLTKADFNISQTHKAYLANGVNGTGSSAGTASNQIGGGSATTTGAYGATYHIVKKGDTLSAIAKRYGTTVDKLCAKNGISKTSILRLGQKIRIK